MEATAANLRRQYLKDSTSLLDKPRKQYLGDDGDRQRTTRARDAAEALFAPKQPTPKTLVAKTVSPADLPAHKPRVLSISRAAISQETAETAIPPVTSAIDGSQIPRIRTWLEYGMTIAQVAAVYGVPAHEIERALQRA